MQIEKMEDELTHNELTHWTMQQFSLSFSLSLSQFHPSFYQFLCDDPCISLWKAEN